MTTFDLVDIYLFNCISTKYRNNIITHCGCNSMVEEMNEIRNMLNNSTIGDTLKACICNRHGHQYCICNDAVINALNILLNDINKNQNSKLFQANKQLIGMFCDFEELYLYVKNLIGGVYGIGPLTVYDTAKRLGHIIEHPIYPKDYVYLHAGAAKGAKSLLKTSKINNMEPIGKFIPYFGTLPSVFIEDLLCVFHKELAVGLENCFLHDVIINASNAFSKKTKFNVII